MYAAGQGYAGAYRAAGHARPWAPGGGPPSAMSSGGMIAGAFAACQR